jgi:hypothetical protein
VWESIRTPRGGSESRPRNRAWAPAGALLACGEGARSMLLFDTYDPALPSARGRHPDPGVEQMVVQVVVQVVNQQLAQDGDHEQSVHGMVQMVVVQILMQVQIITPVVAMTQSSGPAHPARWPWRPACGRIARPRAGARCTPLMGHLCIHAPVGAVAPTAGVLLCLR